MRRGHGFSVLLLKVAMFWSLNYFYGGLFLLLTLIFEKNVGKFAKKYIYIYMGCHSFYVHFVM